MVKLRGSGEAIQYLSPMEEIQWENEVARRAAIKLEKQKEGVYICTHNHEGLSTTKMETPTITPTKI